MANENIGKIDCPFGCGEAHIRRYNSRKPPKEGEEGKQRGKFYIHCRECGPILASSAKVQNYILDKGHFFNAEELNRSKDSPPSGGPDAAPAPKAKTNSPPAAASSAGGAKKKVSFDFDPYA